MHGLTDHDLAAPLDEQDLRYQQALDVLDAAAPPDDLDISAPLEELDIGGERR